MCVCSVYATYVASHRNSVALLDELLLQRKGLREWLQLNEMCLNSGDESSVFAAASGEGATFGYAPPLPAASSTGGNAGQVTLKLLLDAPTARLPQYLLFTSAILNAMRRSTNHSPSDDAYQHLVTAVRAIQQVTDTIAVTLRDAQARKLVSHLQTKIFVDAELISSSRYVVLYHDLKKLYNSTFKHVSKTQTYLFILFNDSLIYGTRPSVTRSADLKHVLPLFGMQCFALNNAVDPSIKGYAMRIETQHKSMTIFAPTEQMRHTWLTALVEAQIVETRNALQSGRPVMMPAHFEGIVKRKPVSSGPEYFQPAPADLKIRLQQLAGQQAQLANAIRGTAPSQSVVQAIATNGEPQPQPQQQQQPQQQPRPRPAVAEKPSSFCVPHSHYNPHLDSEPMPNQQQQQQQHHRVKSAQQIRATPNGTSQPQAAVQQMRPQPQPQTQAQRAVQQPHSQSHSRRPSQDANNINNNNSNANGRIAPQVAHASTDSGPQYSPPPAVPTFNRESFIAHTATATQAFSTMNAAAAIASSYHDEPAGMPLTPSRVERSLYSQPLPVLPKQQRQEEHKIQDQQQQQQLQSPQQVRNSPSPSPSLAHTHNNSNQFQSPVAMHPLPPPLSDVITAPNCPAAPPLLMSPTQTQSQSRTQHHPQTQNQSHSHTPSRSNLLGEIKAGRKLKPCTPESASRSTTSSLLHNRSSASSRFQTPYNARASSSMLGGPGGGGGINSDFLFPSPMHPMDFDQMVAKTLNEYRQVLYNDADDIDNTPANEDEWDT